LGIGEHPLSTLLRVIVGLIGRLLPDAWRDSGNTHSAADTYHGKVVTPAAARKLVTVDEDIQLRDLEAVIPYKLARDIVLKNPDHIVALECPCRASRDNPCEPLDVCLVVGEPFAGFVAAHHARRSRWISPEDAVEILEEEHARGHVHHAFFKDAMLGRFYAICNCCTCCCGAMQSMRNGNPMLTSSGYVSQVDPDQCVLCGDCEDTCPFGALEMGDVSVEVSWQACMGCGVCVSTCDMQAIQLVRDARKGEPLDIEALRAEVPQM
jgi:NAD-dependent dihydropyrimidine dehydrogenase PreA subunit